MVAFVTGDAKIRIPAKYFVKKHKLFMREECPNPSYNTDQSTA